MPEAILILEDLFNRREKIRKENKSLIFTNGCFDGLHQAHVDYLTEAKSYGDYLLVAICPDEIVRLLKGRGKPVYNVIHRFMSLYHLGGIIDILTISKHLSVEYLLGNLRPDIYVKGGDYDIDTINPEERETVKRYGGRIIITRRYEKKPTRFHAPQIQQEKL